MTTHSAKSSSEPHSILNMQAFIQNWDVAQDLQQVLAQAQYRLALEIINAEVDALCGVRYEHDDLHGGRYQRWGTNPGSIKIRSERFPIRVPRVRDPESRQERPLQTYKAMRRPTAAQQEHLSDSIFLGLFQRDYERVNREFKESFGLSASSVSRTFQEYSATVLAQLEARDLSQDTYVVLMLDGTHLKGRQVMLCAGITEGGVKHTLGFAELATENADAVEGFLMKLVNQGLSYDQGLLCVMDGAIGIRKAVRRVFGDYAQIQRCTWHKRENVVGKIKKKKDQETLRRQLNNAYNQDTYEAAKEGLGSIYEALQTEGQHQAARSLMEGMEQTLTLHRLNVDKELRQSLRTTNIMEHLNSQINDSLHRIKRWVNSDQCHRWVAMALKEAEPRLNPIQRTDQLSALQETLREQVQKHRLKSTSNRL